MAFLAPILPWFQIAVAVMLVTAVLLQRSEASLGSAFGEFGGGGFYAKRGLEKKIFIATIILGVLFLVINILALFF